MTVAELQERMTSAEFAEWVALYSIEPFGDDRADLRAGVVASTMANLLGSGRQVYGPGDFLLFSGADAGEASSGPGSREETRSILQAMGAVRVEKGETA